METYRDLSAFGKQIPDSVVFQGMQDCLGLHRQAATAGKDQDFGVHGD